MWNPIRKEGNPIKSEEINTLINKLKVLKVRREGVKSKAKRPIEYDDFINLLQIIKVDVL